MGRSLRSLCCLPAMVPAESRPVPESHPQKGPLPPSGCGAERFHFTVRWTPATGGVAVSRQKRRGSYFLLVPPKRKYAKKKLLRRFRRPRTRHPGSEVQSVCKFRRLRARRRNLQTSMATQHARPYALRTLRNCRRLGREGGIIISTVSDLLHKYNQILKVRF